jgi:hypothetical protein
MAQQLLSKMPSLYPHLNLNHMLELHQSRIHNVAAYSQSTNNRSRVQSQNTNDDLRLSVIMGIQPKQSQQQADRRFKSQEERYDLMKCDK